MKKRTHRIISLLLSIALAIPVLVSAAYATEAETGNGITRAAWLSSLVDTFNMTVEDENYPDNYFSDLESTSEYYYDVLLAVEFGVVDIEAGGEVRPDDPATREFAAQTLNFCLGFQLEEGTSYTFSDADSCTYPDHIQVALNRGWFELIDGAFMPERAITETEAQTMIADAQSVLADDVIDVDYDSSYDFAADVIVIPNGTEVSASEGTVSIKDSPKTIAAGDKFAVYFNNIPCVYTADAVSVDDSVTTIDVTTVELDEAFDSIDAQGSADASIFDVVPLGDSEITYINEETGEEYSDAGVAAAALDGVKAINRTIKSKTSIKLNSTASLELEVQVKNPSIYYSIDSKSAYVYMESDVTVSGKVKGNLAGLAKEGTFDVLKIPVYGVGNIVVSVDVELSGSIAIVNTNFIRAGVKYTTDSGFRSIQGFQAKGFTVVAEVTGALGAKVAFSTPDIPGLKAQIYVKTGGKGSLKSTAYTDGEDPAQCHHLTAYLYFSYGAKAEVKLLGIVKKSWSVEIQLYDENNSPIRVAHHYEDGVEVPACTRGTDYSYYTPGTSSYAGTGWSGGSGSTGYDSEGNPVVIYTYSTDDDGNATITGYKGTATTLIIPETIDGYTVTAIGGSAFANNTKLRIVILPDTVTSIGSTAFSGCSSLESVTLSSNLASIGNWAFRNCSALISVNLPNKLTSVDTYGANYRYPFSGCTSLQSIIFDDGITSIPSCIFGSCTGLKKVIIPDTVTSIGARAFYGCTGLQELQLSKNLESIGNYAFRRCTSLSEILVPKTIKSVDTYGANYWYPFADCSGLTTIKFADGITSVPYALFGNCTGLEEVSIPDTVTTIGGRSFAGCTNLKTVYIPDSVTSIDGSAFNGCTSLANIVLPKNLQSIGNYAFRNCTSLVSINVPKTLTSVDTYGANYWYPFTGCSGIKEIKFDEGVTAIPNCLFGGVVGNSEGVDLVIPEGVISVGDRSFMGFTNLKSVQFPSTLVTIYNSGFESTGLEKVVLPDNLASLGAEAFENCTKLKEVYWNNTISNIQSTTFSGCTSLEKFEFTSAIKTIGSSSFRYCDSLTSVDIPESVTTIGANAFQDCDELEEIIIPESITSIGGSAFYNCDALTSVTIPNSVTSLGTSVFYDCDALTDVTLGTGLTSIPTSTFEHCDVLKEIVLPYRVVSIGASAFKNDVALTSITIPRATTTIDSTAFSYPGKMTIYGVAGTYAETFANANSIKFVDQSAPATAVTLSASTLTINKGGKATLTMSVTPENFTDEVTWKSTDTSVATIADTGVVTAVAVGTATIKVSVGDVSATCKVTVVQPVTSISLNKTSLSLEALGTYQLTATANPSTAANRDVTWSSSNEAVATVDDTGLVTALTKGTATITATAADGSGVTKTCAVTVTNSAHIASTVEELESPHNYANNCSDFWVYTLAGTETLNVTFDERTDIEEDFDFLYIYDGSGNQIGKYTGTTLAGQTVEVPGDTVRIKLVSDSSGNAWGFKVTSVVDPAVPVLIITQQPNNVTVTEGEAATFCIVAEGDGLSYQWYYQYQEGPWQPWSGHTTATTSFTPQMNHDGLLLYCVVTDSSGNSLTSDTITLTVTAKSTEENPFTDVSESSYYYDSVLWAYTNGITTGRTVDGKVYFMPTDSCTRAQAVTFLWRAAGQPEPSTKTNPFSDISTSSYYYKAVLWAYENGITTGKNPGSGSLLFAPNDTCTRAQIVTFLWRTEGKPGHTTSNPFTDVANGGTFTDAILWAYENGITTGRTQGDGSVIFMPNDYCTRAQIVTFLYRDMVE